MHRGYIKLWRKTKGSIIFHNPNLLKVWIWCLIRANHKDNIVPFKTGKGQIEIPVKRGSFVFGRHTAAEELGMPPSTTRNIIRKLKTLGKIAIKEDSQYSIISIVNWELFQPEEDNRKDKQRTSKGQAKDTEKNVKNDKNDKKNIYSETSDEVALASTLGYLILDRKPDYKKILNEMKGGWQKWAYHIGLMIRIDERGENDIDEIIRWCQADEFWQDNILSTKKLREQFDKLQLKMEKGGRDAQGRFR